MWPGPATKHEVKKKLVILTTHFGTNFSGGSLATCEIFSGIEGHFSEVIVLGNELGSHPFRHLTFLKYTGWLNLFRTVQKLRNDDVIFYGDFYNSVIFALSGIPFYFTYHDNWPELAEISLRDRFWSFFYIPVYKLIFRKARVVFSVSDQKLTFIKSFNQKAVLVRNGFNQKHQIEKSTSAIGKTKILMVGTIDARKYRKAAELFKQMDRTDAISIDIYGRIADHRMARKLNAFAFVNLMGFQEHIPYGNYKMLLHTSTMENLPIVFCEAIYHYLSVLAFDVGGSNELIAYPKNGLLVKPYDLSVMKKLIEHPDDFVRKITIDRSVLEGYSWKNASKTYLQYLTA